LEDNRCLYDQLCHWWLDCPNLLQADVGFGYDFTDNETNEFTHCRFRSHASMRKAPAPGSFEGFIYTRLTLFEHIIGLPETLLFSLLFSLGVYFWYRKPKKIWNIVSLVLITLVVLMSTLGYLSAIGIIRRP
jgi:hypothetical protein